MTQFAHELGVPLTTIGSALKRATAKLGAQRPRDLVALMDRVLNAPVSPEKYRALAALPRVLGAS